MGSGTSSRQIGREVTRYASTGSIPHGHVFAVGDCRVDLKAASPDDETHVTPTGDVRSLPRCRPKASRLGIPFRRSPRRAEYPGSDSPEILRRTGQAMDTAIGAHGGLAALDRHTRHHAP